MNEMEVISYLLANDKQVDLIKKHEMYRFIIDARKHIIQSTGYESVGGVRSVRETPIYIISVPRNDKIPHYNYIIFEDMLHDNYTLGRVTNIQYEDYFVTMTVEPIWSQ